MTTLNRSRALLLVVFTIVAVLRSAVAADNPPANDPKQLEMRVYHVQDLLLSVQNYPLHSSLVQPTQLRGREGPPPMQPPFGSATTQPSASAPAVLADPETRLRTFVIDNVASTTWKDNGGDIGSIYIVNGKMFVGQTPENQAGVEKVLAALRENAAQIVRLRVDWVWLEPGGVAAILAGGAGDTSPTPLVNRASPALGKGAVAFSADISCFNGQTIHIASGRARSMTTAATAIVGQNTAAFDPITELVQCGAALQATPVLTETGSATIDLMSEVSEWSPTPPNAPTSVNGLDRLEAIVQHFHTTVQIPVNKPVLIGGMTFNPETDTPAGKQLYLVLEADAAK